MSDDHMAMVEEGGLVTLAAVAVDCRLVDAVAPESVRRRVGRVDVIPRCDAASDSLGSGRTSAQPRRGLQNIPTELFEPERPDCWACDDGGRLFEPCPERLLRLTWSDSTTKPERALIAGLQGCAEHLHAEFPIQGHYCDILLPFRRVVVEHDGEWAHRVDGGRDHLTADRKNTEAIVAAGFAVIRIRDPKLLPLGATGAVDVFPPRTYRPDRTGGPAMTAAILAFVLDRQPLPADWTILQPG